MFTIQRFLPTVLVVLLSIGIPAVADDNIMEGVQYERISPAQPTTAPDGKIEVAELFWYGCPHCFRFEPYIKTWLKNKSDRIVFTRIPAILNPKWETHARVFYAAEALGIGEKIHAPFFNALHVDRQQLYQEEDILEFMQDMGIDKKKFSDAMHSFAVSSKIRRAKKLGQAYKVHGVPSIVVNGKYLTSGSHAGSLKGMIQMTSYLASKELSSKTSITPAASK